MKITKIIILLIAIIWTTILMGAEPVIHGKASFMSKRSAVDPVINRARGYMSKGELQFATHNYGSFIEFEDYSSPSGLYKGYQYISDASFMLGVAGRDSLGNPNPWAMRPMYSTQGERYRDSLVYWGATLSESWFDRVSDKKQTDWESVLRHRGSLHSGEVAAGEIYGGIYTDTGDPYPLLASSDIPLSWPNIYNEFTGEFERTWPGDWAADTDPQSPNYGKEIYGRHIGDQDIYMEFDDRLAIRDEDLTQGYPMGIKVRVNAHSYGRSYAEDIAFFTVEIINESYKGFPMDFSSNGENDGLFIPYVAEDGTYTYEIQDIGYQSSLESGAGYNYTDAYGGFYFDADSYSRLENGSYSGRSNDDDMMMFDTTYDMAFIWDWDDDSNGVSNLAYSALKLLDTPPASKDLDMDGDGVFDILKGEPLGLTDWHWFDWYNRPGVVIKESNTSGSCGNDYAGSSGCPGAEDKESIMYAILSGDTAYLNTPKYDWEWRGIDPVKPNSEYANWFFHEDMSGITNPHFDSYEKMRQDNPDGLDCVFIMSAGPFDLAPGDTTYFSFAVIMGDPPNDTKKLETPSDLADNAEMAQIMYDLKYQGFSPPESPNVFAIGDDEKVTLYWDSKAEVSHDVVTGYSDFEGYKVYRSTDGGTTWGDPITDIIYNTDGFAVAWKPIAQFDLSATEDSIRYNGRKVGGPDPLAPWMNLGDNTGIEHEYVDNDVINGVQYCYAVVAYDIGIEAPYTISWELVTDDSTYDDPIYQPDTIISENNPDQWPALESLENYKGNSSLLPQFVQVTPNARPTNAPTNYGVYRTGKTKGTGKMQVLPASVAQIEGNSNIYHMIVNATPVGDANNNPPYYTKNAEYSVVEYNRDFIDVAFDANGFAEFSILDSSVGDTIIGWKYAWSEALQTWIADTVATLSSGGTIPAELGEGVGVNGPSIKYGPVWGGFQLLTENYGSAVFDSIAWVDMKPEDAPNYSFTFDNQLGYGTAFAADYEILWGIDDTVKFFAPDNGEFRIPFTVINTSRNEDFNNNGVLDPDEDTNSNGILDVFTKVKIQVQTREQEGFAPISGYEHFKSGNVYLFKEMYVPGVSEDRDKTTWKFTLTWNQLIGANVRHFTSGMITKIAIVKPFEKDDELWFDAETASKMDKVSKASLEEIMVVPNPYIVSAGWEQDIHHKSIHFTHLPDEAVIKIFTLTGELVYTILHKDVFSGQAEWNLRSMNRQEVAPGLYVFAVEAPNYESYVGKFAIIR
jgi:hypothetical protein